MAGTGLAVVGRTVYLRFLSTLPGPYPVVPLAAGIINPVLTYPAGGEGRGLQAFAVLQPALARRMAGVGSTGRGRRDGLGGGRCLDHSVPWGGSLVRKCYGQGVWTKKGRGQRVWTKKDDGKTAKEKGKPRTVCFSEESANGSS